MQPYSLLILWPRHCSVRLRANVDPGLQIYRNSASVSVTSGMGELNLNICFWVWPAKNNWETADRGSGCCYLSKVCLRIHTQNLQINTETHKMFFQLIVKKMLHKLLQKKQRWIECFHQCINSFSIVSIQTFLWNGQSFIKLLPFPSNFSNVIFPNALLETHIMSQ